MSEHQVLEMSQLDDTERFSRGEIARAMHRSESQIRRDLATLDIDIPAWRRLTRAQFIEVLHQLHRMEKRKPRIRRR